MPMKNAEYEWKCHPEAERLVENFIEEACQQNAALAALSRSLLSDASSRLFDWIDHIVVGHTEELIRSLKDSGYLLEATTSYYRVYHHPGAQLPRLVVKDQDTPLVAVAVHVENISSFLMMRGMTAPIEGSPLSGYRRSCASTENGVSLYVVERRGTLTMEPTYTDNEHANRYFYAQELWKNRPRNLYDEENAIECALETADQMVSLMGKDLAAWIVLECEREYWQGRNTAGQIQKNRQDRLGMGWGNHDHHTFRSSRKFFSKLVRLFEILGFHCRERFYAGEEAGWGAQVMENPNCRLVLFLDVDHAKHELGTDFAHQELPELNDLGTIGLWCALHGDSILKAGMHHLEAQFMFDDLKASLAKTGIQMMEPFSSFPYLKQAFTQGEVWPVAPDCVEKLLDAHKISKAQAERFLNKGAIGSHLENLQRREGYKGFNQKNVSVIIEKTDPRKQLA